MIERATRRASAPGAARTVFFLDEIHRFNKAQQDALLPAVEEGLVTLIGATTENPRFEVNGALLSRLRVYALERARPRTRSRCCCAARASAASSAEARASTTRRSSCSPRAAEATRAIALGALELGARNGRELGEPRSTLARAEDALAAARGPLRPRGRPPLRHDLGLDQGDPRLATPTPRCTTWR